MERLKKFFLIALALTLVVWSFYVVLTKPAPAKYQHTTSASDLRALKVEDATLQVEVAQTDATRERGLSGRESLAPGYGMFFIFETPAAYGFWMKEMNFPLDIVWINEAFQVVGVERDVQPESYPQVYTPLEAVKYVLEIPAGEAARLNIDRGTKVSF